MHKRALVLVLLIASVAMAELPAPPAPMSVSRTSAPITIDGALGDAGWQGAAVIDKFYETSPGDNIPAKIKTVAYLTYDAKYFYIGIKADDPDPKKIRAPFVDRDGVIGTDDNIAIFLDTRNDKRSALELRVNPRGVQGDGIFNDANGNEDFSPDFYYDTAAQITNEGWTAEFRIPFSSLRYNSAAPQTWNILVWRNWPREYRYAFHSAPIARNANCLVCFTHPLTGFSDLPEASHFVAAPYVTAQSVAEPEGDLGTNLGDAKNDADAGIDVKWNPSANHTIDFTLNPDFSQIEADVPQILVNQRFAVFFPEKRPFFLEGFDLFDTPLQVAYTRTITDPNVGVRATGKFGGTAYTFLTTQDDGGGATIIPGPTRSSFALLDMKSYATIARVRHDLGKSFVGGVFTDREIDGGGHNRVIGPDFQWRPNDEHKITAQFLLSDTENPLRPDLSSAWDGQSTTSHAFTAAWDARVKAYDFGGSVYDVGDGFRADMGFIPQVGYREAFGYLGKSYYPENNWLRFHRPSIVLDKQVDQNNDTIFDRISLGWGGVGAKNTNFGVLLRSDNIKVEDELLHQNYVILQYQFDPSRRVPRLIFSATLGDQIDFDNAREGTGTTLAATAMLRPSDRLDMQLDLNRNTVDVDGGRLFTAYVERLRSQYSFSAKSLVRVIAQYVTTDYDPSLYTFGVPEKDGSFLGSVLYSYKLNWQTVLFVGYGDDRVLLDNDHLARTGRSLFFKVSYAFIR